jgi:hypothetical protein
MGKWINISGTPGSAWYVADDTDFGEVAKSVEAGRMIELPLRDGLGGLVLNGERIAAYAYGEDEGLGTNN